MRYCGLHLYCNLKKTKCYESSKEPNSSSRHHDQCDRDGKYGSNRLWQKGAAKYEVEKNLVKVNLDPVFVKKGKKIMMNLLNVSQGKVLLKVYDSENRLVFDEAIDGDIVVEKAFNFEKAFKDEYTIVVVDKFGTYTETVEVR